MNKFWRNFAFSGACALGLACAFLTAMIYFSPRPQLLEGVPFGGMVLDSDGKLIRAFLSSDDKYRFYIPLEKVAPFASTCLFAYEDKYFYYHPGFNPLSMLRAIAQWPFTGRLTGASTISMQLARLRYKLHTSGASGKLKQIWKALILERHYSKDELLEAYFNLAPYGANVEGIEAASRIYFHKSASQLTETEVVALTVIPQNPAKRRSRDPGLLARARKGLASRLGLGYAPEIKISEIKDLPFLAPHLALELEKGRKNNENSIQTGIIRGLQTELEKRLANYTERIRNLGISNAAAMLVDSESMQVVALAGSANFYNPDIEGQVDGTRARRSPGSTLKPFIYALALDQGLIHPMSILPDSPRTFGFYNPENFDHGFRGPLSARDALKASRNLPAIRLAQQLANPDLYDFLESANIRFEHGPQYYGLALALGGAELSMRELASLYAMLANGGLWKRLRFMDSDPEEAGRRLLSPEAAWLALDMLRDEDFSTGLRHIPVYAKTGTSNGMRDAWMAGICGKYVLVVWLGNFNNRPNPHLVGARVARPLFEELCALIGQRMRLYDPLARRPVKISQIDICLETGDIYSGQCTAHEKSWFIPGRSPIRDSGILRPVLIEKKSGLRACEYVDGKTDKVWWEFWPSDLKAIFAQAGIIKAEPPPWLPECARKKERLTAKNPEIKLPSVNVQYQRQLSGPELQIPLMASTDPEASQLHWYANASYIGSSRPEETILWQPECAGIVELVAVDNLGRSQRRKCVIKTVP